MDCSVKEVPSSSLLRRMVTAVFKTCDSAETSVLSSLTSSRADLTSRVYWLRIFVTSIAWLIKPATLAERLNGSMVTPMIDLAEAQRRKCWGRSLRSFVDGFGRFVVSVRCRAGYDISPLLHLGGCTIVAQILITWDCMCDSS